MKILKISSLDELKEILKKDGCGLFDMPDSLYHHPDCPGVSRSTLNEFAKSGEHYLYSKLKPREPSDAMKLGSAFHISVLQPENINLVCGVLPKFKGVKGNTIASQRDAYIAGQEDRLWITQDQLDTMQRMTLSIGMSPLIKELRSCDHIEVAAFCTDPTSGEIIKCKPDAFCIKDGSIRIYDLKSTKKGGGTSHEFSRQVCNPDSRLYVQSAMYSYILHSVLKLPIEYFKFIVVEKEPPYPVSCYKLSDDFNEFALEQMSADLEDFAICKKQNRWPGYSTETQTIELPRWMLSND